MSDQSLKFSTVEAGEFVGGVETVKIRRKFCYQYISYKA